MSLFNFVLLGIVVVMFMIFLFFLVNFKRVLEYVLVGDKIAFLDFLDKLVFKLKGFILCYFL